MSEVPDNCPLNDRELFIARRLSEGAQVAQIAFELELSTHQVNKNLQMATRIAAVKTQPALVAKAIRCGWIE